MYSEEIEEHTTYEKKMATFNRQYMESFLSYEVIMQQAHPK